LNYTRVRDHWRDRLYRLPYERSSWRDPKAAWIGIYRRIDIDASL